MRQIWTLVVVLAIAGCAVESDAEVAAAWRHRDGTAVSAAEITDARTACTRVSVRELSPAETDFNSDPAFHPGGIGLEDGRKSMDLNAPLWRNIGRQPIPLTDCLVGKGFVRAP